jgi:hypothetical protein
MCEVGRNGQAQFDRTLPPARSTGIAAVVNESGSKIRRAATALALITPGILVLCVIGAFSYDVYAGLGGLIPIFLLGSVPLALAATLDVLCWRRIAAPRDPSLLRESSAAAASLATTALALLLFGAFFTAIDLSAGDKSSAFASGTSSTVVSLLLAALVAQTVLLVLTWTARRSSFATDRTDQ